MSASRPMQYFAYGSNLSRRRLLHRLPAARWLSTAQLPGYRLAFDKRGADGSGKCHVQRTDGATEVCGCLYALSEIDLQRLDRLEGVGQGYERVTVQVAVAHRRQAVVSYIAQPEHIEPGLPPYDWYLRHVIIGAQENDLPDDYIAWLRSIPTRPDPDNERRRRELAIHV